MSVDGPFFVDFVSLQITKEHLQLFDRDAVAGQNAKKINQKVRHHIGDGRKHGQHVLYQTDFRASLQISQTFSQERDEHAPNFGL